jgi:hypothetical protein
LVKQDNKVQIIIFFSSQDGKGAQHSWLMPIILANWKAEIRRIVVQGQPGLIIVHKTLSRKYPTQKSGSSGRAPDQQV